MPKTIMPKSGRALTSVPVKVPHSRGPVPERPEFIRLPIKGLCPWTGLSRTAFYELMAAGKIKMINLRKEGREKGIRLVPLQPLLDYLYSQMDGGSASARRSRKAA